jgi:hypothetical protein
MVQQAGGEKALDVLDTVLSPLGFQKFQNTLTGSEICRYALRRPSTLAEDALTIRVTKTPAGIEVAFGHFGFLGSTPKLAVRAFKDPRVAFIENFGKKNVKTKTLGEPAAGGKAG